VTYPEPIEVGIRVDRLGNSSVRYGVAIFRAGEDAACAHGHFVHVFVERRSNRSAPMPGPLRGALEGLILP
jgi:acyl-CoA thioester hydrolase